MHVIERNTRNTTVRLTNKHWDRLMELETAYLTAQAVARAKRQCQAAPSMSVSEAIKFIDTL